MRARLWSSVGLAAKSVSTASQRAILFPLPPGEGRGEGPQVLDGPSPRPLPEGEGIKTIGADKLSMHVDVYRGS